MSSVLPNAKPRIFGSDTHADELTGANTQETREGSVLP